MIVGLCGQAGSGKDAAADFLVKNHGLVKVAFADPLKRIVQDVFGFTDEQLWGPSARRNAPDRRWEHGPAAYREAALRDFALGAARARECGESWQEDVATLTHFESAVRYAAEGWLTPRHALQQLGSEWGRRCSPDTWVRYALNVHTRLQSGDVCYDARTGLRPISSVGDLVMPKVDVVISDVRFRNEVTLLQRAGGRVVRVVRKERPLPRAVSGPLLDKIPWDLWELIDSTTLLEKLSAPAAAHVSETEQKELPDELFDHHLINGGISLALLEAAVDGLAAELQAA